MIFRQCVYWNSFEKIWKPEDNIEYDLEQYFHQNCLLPHSEKETKDENKDEVTIKTLNVEVNTEISHEDLDR